MYNIPSWVFILFLILLYLGIKRCFTQIVSVKRLAIVPIAFVFMSLRSATHLFADDAMIWMYLTGGMVFGAFLGHFQVRNRYIRADKNKNLIEIPGDISMLILLMGIFAIEFFIHYSLEAHLEITSSDMFRIAAMAMSGLMVGISVGRNLTYFYKYTQAASIDLQKK